MTIKEIETKYRVVKFNDIYLIYIESNSGRRPYKYLCKMKKVNTRFMIEDFEPTSSFEQLELDIKKHLYSLAFNSDYFDPSYRDGVAEELFVHDHLTSIGFVSERDIYVYKPKNIFGSNTTELSIGVSGLNSFDKCDYVNITIYHNGFSITRYPSEKDISVLKKDIDYILGLFLFNESMRLFMDATKVTDSSIMFLVADIMKKGKTDDEILLFKNNLLEMVNNL